MPFEEKDLESRKGYRKPIFPYAFSGFDEFLGAKHQREKPDTKTVSRSYHESVWARIVSLIPTTKVFVLIFAQWSNTNH